MRKLMLFGVLAVLLIAPVSLAQNQQVTAALTAQDSGACSTANACLVLKLNANSGATVVQLSGTWMATGLFEGTADGANWVAVNASPVGGTTAVQSTVSAGAWQLNVAGMVAVRLRISAYTSGTIQTVITSSVASAAARGGSGSGGTPASPTLSSQYNNAGSFGGTTVPATKGTFPIIYNLPTDSAVAPGPLQNGFTNTAITGAATTYTIAFSDNLQGIEHDVAGSASVTYTLPTPTTLENPNFAIPQICNYSTHTDTLTPTTWTVNLASSVTIPSNTCRSLSVDPFNANNWLAPSGGAPSGPAGSVQTNNGAGGFGSINSPAGQWKKQPSPVLIPTLSAQQNAVYEPRPFNLTALGAAPAILTTADIPTGATVGGMFFTGGWATGEVYYTEFLDPAHLTLTQPQAAFAGQHACEAYFGSTWYAVTPNQSPGSGISHGLNILSGSTPLNMTSLATGIVTTGTWGSITVTNLGNCSLNFIGSTYYLFIDALNSGTGVWQVWLYSSPNLTSGGTWTLVQTTPVVTTAADPVSFRVAGTNLYYMWPHAAPSGTLPSDVYFYKATSLTSWAIGNSGNVVLPRTTTDEGANTAVGQFADADLLDWNGKCFLYASASPNGGNNNVYGGSQTIKMAIGDQPCNTMGAAATQSLAQPGPAYANLSLGVGALNGIMPVGTQIGLFGSNKGANAAAGFIGHFSASSTTDILSVMNGCYYNFTAYSRVGTAGCTVIQQNSSSTEANNSFSFDIYTPGGTLVQPLALAIDGSGNSQVFMTLTNSATGDYVCYNATLIEFNTATCTLSLRKYKMDIAPLHRSLAEVMRLRPVEYRYKPELKLGTRLQVGLIADEVAKIDPRLGAYKDNGELESVDYEHMTAVLAAAIQEQQREIVILKRQVSALRRTKRP